VAISLRSELDTMSDDLRQQPLADPAPPWQYFKKELKNKSKN